MTNDQQMAYLKQKGRVRYCEPEMMLQLPQAPMVKIYVMGPPRNEKLLGQMTCKREQYALDEATAFGAAACTATGLLALDDRELFARSCPFTGEKSTIPVGKVEESPWFATFFKPYLTDKAWQRLGADWLGTAEQLALLRDTWMNNTSLVLAIELPGSASRPVLLFVGDAQYGNWISWQTLTFPDGATGVDLLRRTVLYKVGHHGSENATLREKGLELMDHANLVALLPVDSTWANEKKHWEHPADALEERLRTVTQGRLLRSDHLPPANLSPQFAHAVSYEGDLWVQYAIAGTDGGAGSAPPAASPAPSASLAATPFAATRLFDAHCHLFNLPYALRETLNIGWDAIRHQYKRAGEEGDLGLAPLAPESSLRDKLRALVAIFKAATDSCEGNFRTENEAWRKSMLAPQHFSLMPLMMDIYYIFLTEQQPVDHFHLARPAMDEVTAFTSFAREFVAELTEQSLAAAGDLAMDAAALRDIVNQCIAEVQAEASGLSLLPARPRIDFAGMPVSWGYREHMEDLLKLQQQMPTRIFPFIAIDPRRPNVLRFLLHGKTDDKPIISKRGPFYGVKVYPPLGYCPYDPKLMEVYAWCVEHDIPVTAHCQWFSFDKAFFKLAERPNNTTFWAHPRHWRPVLKAYPDLRLNLAHFGGNKQVLAYAGVYFPEREPADDGSWTKEIIWLIERYDNVYTDIGAGYADGMTEAIDNILQRHPKVADHLMFGTDYVICMMNLEPGGLQGQLDQYFTRYAHLPSRLLYENAAQFIG
ncbi:MAG: Amidohydrolase [bacterium ADurb.Bin429]|nr:MAG: Amidohydrolase [bacterium ADurb.Bin429]